MSSELIAGGSGLETKSVLPEREVVQRTKRFYSPGFDHWMSINLMSSLNESYWPKLVSDKSFGKV
jgi:hypothetical protein